MCTSQFKIKIYKYQTDTDKTLIFKFERQINQLYIILKSMALIIVHFYSYAQNQSMYAVCFLVDISYYYNSNISKYVFIHNN